MPKYRLAASQWSFAIWGTKLLYNDLPMDIKHVIGAFV